MALYFSSMLCTETGSPGACEIPNRLSIISASVQPHSSQRWLSKWVCSSSPPSLTHCHRGGALEHCTAGCRRRAARWRWERGSLAVAAASGAHCGRGSLSLGGGILVGLRGTARFEPWAVRMLAQGQWAGGFHATWHVRGGNHVARVPLS
ncbi:hypothetical protein BC834DRAFT_607834 [Gloeopeniophorella convolvens]|nr:hypothetical protein BC834DRAFT_607834 [Gloeopeniophorella convolvens]